VHHALERLLLVGHVALAGLDQLRQLVVPLRKQHVDVRPGLAHIFAQRHQAVVDADDVDRHDHQQREKQQQHNEHLAVSLATKKAAVVQDCSLGRPTV